MDKIKKINFFALLVIIVGTVLISMTMVKSGLMYNFGLGFWGPNGHDAIWHISLINQLKQHVPPYNPIFSDTYLTNYHWGFDLFAAQISNLLKINTLDIYFRVLPVIFALLIGLLSYEFAFLLSKNKVTATIFVFLNYFAGSFGWIVTLFQNKTIGGESLFWSMQSASVLLNPPFALSLILILTGLILWVKHNSSKKIIWPIFIGIIFGLLSLIKVYAGILIGLSLSFYFLVQFISKKKWIKFNFIICLITALTSIVILYFLGIFSQSSQLLEFKPFWFIHSLIESTDKLFIPKLASYRFNLAHNLTFIKFPLFVAIETILFIIFFVGNMGTRILGFFYLILNFSSKNLIKFNKLALFFLFYSLLFPTLFVQKGTAWNTIQFFYYFLFISNIYLALFLSKLWNKYKILTVLIILVSIPTSISTLKDYFGFPPPSSLPKKELEALNFLKNQNNGIVLTYPYDKYKKNTYSSTPLPLSVYETTAYVSAFSQKPVYMEDEMNLDITGFDWKMRLDQENTFFKSQDKFYTRGFLLNNKIDYIYLTNGQKFSINPNDLQIDKIYDNEQSQIYKVRK